jgi:NTE family protein
MLWKQALHSIGRSLHRFGQRSEDGGSVRIGLALGGGFARGVAHIGVIRAMRRYNIPIHAIAGVSAGSVVAAAYASGTAIEEIEDAARMMKFRDVAQWTLDWKGVLDSERMDRFLRKLLRNHRFEDMVTPLAVVASDLSKGTPAVFRKFGDAVTPVRASCSYPGLFKPVEYQGRLLVDGMVAMEVPAKPLQEMGATHVLSVYLPGDDETVDPLNVVQIVNRSFQVMSARLEHEWRRYSDLVITPQVGYCGWDSFDNVSGLIQSGEKAVEQAMPTIADWLKPESVR